MVGNEDFLQILKKKYLKKKLPSMQRVIFCSKLLRDFWYCTLEPESIKGETKRDKQNR